jgi:hypothetical protein
LVFPIALVVVVGVLFCGRRVRANIGAERSIEDVARAGTNIQGRERPESRSFAELLVDVEEALPAWAVVFELLAEIDVSGSRVTADTANGPRIH